jgi:hypothetical protein
MLKGPEYKNTLLNFDLKSFLEEFSGKNPGAVKKKYPELYLILASQLNLYPKAKKKLPTFAEKYCYFTTKSYEQSSSEALANYKAKLFSGNTLIDLTGGLGVDDYAFSRSFNKVISVDNDLELNELARINFSKLDIDNIVRIDSTAEDSILTKPQADLVYIDADRRTSTHKAVTLYDSSPPVLELLHVLFKISGSILLKLSPLIDITYLVRNLQQIRDIRVISLDNEVKEVLVHLDSSFQGQIMIYAVDLNDKDEERILSAPFGRKRSAVIDHTGKFFYEPSAAIVKAGLADHYAASFGINLISKNGVFMTGDKSLPDFFGRGFLIVNHIKYGKAMLKKYFKDHNISKANVSCRNFPVSEAGVKKHFSISDGGNEYLFFTTNSAGEKFMYHCCKLDQ